MRVLPVYPHRPRLAIETAEPLDVDRECTRCKLHEGARNVCLSAEGEPGGLLVVGESPGRTEDALGRPFVGESGKLLRGLLRQHWQGPVAIDNALRCAPGRREVTDKHVEACRGFLTKTIAEVRPMRIVALGSWAAYALTGRGIAPMSNRRGYTHLFAGVLDDRATRQFGDRPVPVFYVLHPAAALRNRFVRQWFEADLRWALTAPAPEPAPLEAELRIVETAADAAEAVRELRAAPWAVPDVEAAGVMHTPSYRLLCLSFCPAGSDSPWAWNAAALRDPATRDPMLAYLRDPTAKKRGQNIQYDLVAMEVALGVRTRGVEGDTRLWRKLLEPEADGKLDKMVELVGMGGMKEEAADEMAVYVERVKRGLRAEALLAKRAEQPTKKWPKLRPEAQEGLDYLRALEVADPALVGVIREDPSEWQRWAFALIPDDMLLRYNARDTISTAKISTLIEGQLAEEPDIDRVRRAVVDPAAVAIARVERWGVCASRTAIQAFDAYLLIKLDEVRRRLDQYGKDFNPGSPKQVGELLFGRLGLQPIKFTDSGAPSTDDSVLELLAPQHPVAADIAEYRRLDKLQGNYASGMLPHVRADGRIHTTILLDGARCLPAGELVLTSRGYLPVQHVRVGDLVLTHEGRARAVTATFTNSPRPIVRVRLANGLTLRTTEDHEYMTEAGWVRAGDLVVGIEVRAHAEPEQWRPVEGWPYLVSSWGRVKHSRSRVAGQGVLALQAKYRGTAQGHLKVTLVRGDRKRASGGRADFGVHQLVLRAFGGAQPSGAGETRHLNGIPWDNTVGNLAWGTAAENRADAVAHGADFAPATRHLSADDVAFIRAQPRKPRGGAGRWAKAGVSDSALALRFGVSREQVRDIRSGKRWLDDRAPSERAVGRRASFFTSPVVAVELEPPAHNFGLAVDEDHSHVTGGIVTHNSGRTSSSNPNLQNIPRVSDEKGNTEGKMARDCFVASPGCTLVELDYSQLELRIAAMMSGDPEMLAIFEAGVDYHLRTAQLVSHEAWGIPPEAVVDAHRSAAKTINFAVLYGMGDAALAAKIGCSKAAARRVHDAIMGRFRVLAAWIAQRLSEARRTGVAWTWWNGHRARRRPLWRIADQDDGARINAENSAHNTPVQGTASEFCIASLIEVVRWIEDDGLEDVCKLVLPIHDALLLDVRNDYVREVRGVVREIMEGHNSGAVALKADCKTGPAWGSLQKVKD